METQVGGLIPLSDASRRPARLPVVTALIIAVNVVVFLLELMRGDAFVMQWSAIPAQIISGHHPHCDVHAWQLVAHHREHGLSMGLRP
jgi:membrane associated rhomboid family serine protease